MLDAGYGLLVRQLNCYLQFPSYYVRGSTSAIEAVLRQLLYTLCRLQQRDQEWKRVGVHTDSPLGAFGLLRNQLGSRSHCASTRFACEVASIYSECAHLLGYIEPLVSTDEIRSEIAGPFKASIDEQDFTIDQILQRFESPAWVVHHEQSIVFCYAGAPGEKWAFLDFQDGWLFGIRHEASNQVFTTPKGRIAYE